MYYFLAKKICVAYFQQVLFSPSLLKPEEACGYGQQDISFGRIKSFLFSKTSGLSVSEKPSLQ
jgi:hypothetical protein